ncbi:hypothetical protein BKA01_006988 [Pseudonocardia eucalypti]|nr:hypothetical protein [Pseudonocardia eucalypti]
MRDLGCGLSWAAVYKVRPRVALRARAGRWERWRAG